VRVRSAVTRGTEVYIRVPRAALCLEQNRSAEEHAVKEMVG